MRSFLTSIFVILGLTCTSQVSQSDLIQLAKIYKEYHAWNTPDSSVFEQIEEIKSKGLENEKHFIAEVIKINNDILNKRFLSKPDTSTLKNIYLIRQLTRNMYADKPLKHSKVISQTNWDSINYIELLANYYDIIFGFMVNKHEDLNLNGVNFDFEELGFNTQIEKEVFFFTSFNCVVYINYVWIPRHDAVDDDFKKAMIGFSRLPTYNRMPYYLFQNLEVAEFREEYADVDELNDGYKWLTKILKSQSLLLDYQLNYLEKNALHH
jgi:hypothetical protein